MIRFVFCAALAVLAACASSRGESDGDRPAGNAADSAARDTAGGNAVAPPLSRADSSIAVVGGDTLRINYSRPLMRGRVIFGGLVPYGQVWRTGANAATSLVTAADLEINGVRVPAGSYTLYSIPEGADAAVARWQLIVNKQTGQWGTEYHAEQDLARIPLRVSTSEEPVQRFTITLEPAGADRATLALAWDRAVGTADVRVRP